MFSETLEAERPCGKAVETFQLLDTSTAQELLAYASNGGSKRAVRRWFEAQTVGQLFELKNPVFGLLVRFSHPRPKTGGHGKEFQRLVELYQIQSLGRVA